KAGLDSAAFVPLPIANQSRPPINHAATAGAAPPFLGEGAGCGRRGNCQSRRKAGTTTCSNRNAPITSRNATAPFEQRSAAQASSVQPRTQPAERNHERCVTQP